MEMTLHFAAEYERILTVLINISALGGGDLCKTVAVAAKKDTFADNTRWPRR